MNKTEVITESNGEVFPKTGRNLRQPYNHQKMAMTNLDIIDENDSYSTLVVLPTGGGKTYTAAMWLLMNAIDRKKKILWIAHRQYLLDQAGKTFRDYAFSEIIPSVNSFRYRIISGDSKHDRTVDIDSKDNLLIISKDSIGRNLSALDNWVKGEDEIYFVIDEAHHATAKTYRKVIEYMRKKVKNVKLIGLTATPFRTAENEKGLLGKIFTDGVENGVAVKNEKGISYQISLKELISKQILSNPTIERYNTGEDYSKYISSKDLERIQRLDILPDEVMDKMLENSVRSKFIAETYKANRKKYGQTIVFAMSVTHAIQLSTVFNEFGIKADYVVSNVKDAVTGVTRSAEENHRVIEQYRKGELEVIINVNILTEGVDLPKTQTVFLARPTVSKILMTQMVGRALRGEAAGGTKNAYIVSFVDNGLDKIAWSNPETIFEGSNDFADTESDYEKRDMILISIAKMEEFAKMLNKSADTKALEKIPFTQRIPLGMYVFNYLEEEGMDISYQVMVYDSTKTAYEQMMDALPEIFKGLEIDEEYPSKEVLEEAAEKCRTMFFLGEMIPPYDINDIIHILQYYAQNETIPEFYSFDYIEKNKIDPCVIAKEIIEKKFDPVAKAEYINELWNNGEENLLQMFFGRQKYLYDQIDREILRLTAPYIFDSEENVKYGRKKFENMSLYEIGKINPQLEKTMRDKAFEDSKNSKGKYVCAGCGQAFSNRIPLQVDHIIPMNKGGKTVQENLQILCRHCNGEKGDK